MIHKHKFVSAGEVTKTLPLPPGSSFAALDGNTISGTLYVCIDPKCGAKRAVWLRGDVEVIAEGLPEEE